MYHQTNVELWQTRPLPFTSAPAGTVTAAVEDWQIDRLYLFQPAWLMRGWLPAQSVLAAVAETPVCHGESGWERWPSRPATGEHTSQSGQGAGGDQPGRPHPRSRPASSPVGAAPAQRGAGGRLLSQARAGAGMAAAAWPGPGPAFAARQPPRSRQLHGRALVPAASVKARWCIDIRCRHYAL